ncbi:RNA ligase-domain-containing protein [Epithele typhae]|uniref:RNA ligase-domain-containing protein n=1 Tax=Epithele typhae TaxID=378194 RepID=UPI002007A508|nr:RNA ligase-domain-containing protein [Epithele typhae]KAH9930453.1 RNA ligase-domain-containing protein [Epithele typhae]
MAAVTQDATPAASPPAISGSETADEFSELLFDEDDSDLVEKLKQISKEDPKLVKASDYQAPADPGIIIRSWKMNEFKYYNVPTPFPTLARGLFTQDIKKGKKMMHRIVVRGYDKFFNIGEVPWNTWNVLEEHTAPPYTLTLKSNGCIIFIAALTPTKLVVTSKHSLGAVPSGQAPTNESHAQVGQRWLHTHLQSVGKSEEDLAHTLWEKDWTAVAELCDDSFEEHVLPYTAEKTGLHLHGLNACTGAFQTQPQDVVDAFAQTWGFIVTASTVLPTIPAVKSFTEEISRAGSWNGEPLEGFVVRTRVTTPLPNGPYPAGASFFFKVKFDEPYLMYREWREVTKSLLTHSPDSQNVPKHRMRRPETRLYVDWVCREIKANKSQFDNFTKGKGIIKTRERFLAWLETEEGQKAKANGGLGGEAQEKRPKEKEKKVIIVPIAIPGLGKTTVAVALQALFGFGHVQADDIPGKKSKSKAGAFVKEVEKAFKSHDVVIADRNNHLMQHREQLLGTAKKQRARLVALYWPLDDDIDGTGAESARDAVFHICAERIDARGANHQLLIPGDPGAHEAVLHQFMRQHEPLASAREGIDSDDVVYMDVRDTLEDAVARAAGAIADNLGLEKPDAEKMGAALAKARAYAPKRGKVRYYAISGEFEPQPIVEAALAAVRAGDVPRAARTMWTKLVENGRVQDEPHVTLAHTKNLPGDQPLWDACAAFVSEIAAGGGAVPLEFKLGELVWDDRVMAFTVEDLKAAEGLPNAEVLAATRRFASGLGPELKQRLHVTVGTRDRSVPPVEAMSLVQRWRKGESGIWSVPVGETVRGRVEGLTS